MNDNIAITIEALTTDPIHKRHIEEVEDLDGKLGIRHDGDEFSTSAIIKEAKSHGLELAIENEDENMLVFA